ncbi:MAG: DMT family transporter [Coriobacteriaceae bacterium]|nr:DMT family transporter [Coriobacteriaceae bacterium]
MTDHATIPGGAPRRGSCRAGIADERAGAAVRSLAYSLRAPDATSAADAPVAPEDRFPGDLRGAGARSPLFWKLLLVGMALTWGLSFFITKGALDALPPYQLLAWRFLPSALIMLALFHRRIRAHLNTRNLAVGIGVGLITWIGYAFQTNGLDVTTAGKNAFLTGTYCIFVPFISHVISREQLTRYNIGAAVLCLAGIGFVALDDLSANLGDALSLAGAFFFALQIASIAKFGRDLDVNVITFWMFLTVGSLSAVPAVLLEPAPPASTWTWGLIATLAFLAVICTCVGLLIQNLALAHVPASTGSLLLSLESPSGVFFSVVMAGEAVSGRLLVGFALIFTSIVLSETHFSFVSRYFKRPVARAPQS